MPKETVQYPKINDMDSTEVSVHWVRDSHVQLEIIRHPGLEPTPPVHQHLTDCDCKQSDQVCQSRPAGSDDNTPVPDTELGHKYANVPDAIIGEVEGPVVMFTEVLTRSELNRMIRALRRARDAAYGADA